MKISVRFYVSSIAALTVTTTALGLSLEPTSTRREALKSWAAGSLTGVGLGLLANAPSGADTMIDGTLDVESFLRSGMVSMPMGVAGQAGKSRPETGVILRDGYEVSRDSRSGSVLAEIILKGNYGDNIPVLASYQSPWPLATGTVFDVECRDPATGDAAFLSVTSKVQGKTLSQLPDSFFVDNLFSNTGRFSFYGAPTDINIKKSSIVEDGKYKTMDLSFSTLSQSTQAEIPRRARMIATIPDGTDQAVMLVASASANRWKKGSETVVSSVIESFRATPAPQTSLKVRAKERRSSS